MITSAWLRDPNLYRAISAYYASVPRLSNEIPICAKQINTYISSILPILGRGNRARIDAMDCSLAASFEKRMEWLGGELRARGEEVDLSFETRFNGGCAEKVCFISRPIKPIKDGKQPKF